MPKAGARGSPEPGTSSPPDHAGGRATPLPHVGASPPGAPRSAGKQPAPPPGPAGSSPPTALATARVSPPPPSGRQPAVAVRPPAFRPVPIQAPGPAGSSTRAQGGRSAPARVAAHTPRASTSAAPPQIAPHSATINVAPPKPAPRAAAAPPAPPAQPRSAREKRPAPPAATRPTTAVAAPAGAARPVAHARAAAAPTAAASTSAGRIASPVPRRLLTGSATPTLTTGDPAALGPLSPPPPRGSAQDSLAAMTPYSSREASDLSMRSCGSEEYSQLDLELGLELEQLLEARPQRRPRSSDDEADDEAKRVCAGSPLPQREPRGRAGADSPTFAEAVRRSPTTTSAAAAAPDDNPVSTQANIGKNAGATGKKKPRYPPLVVERLPNWAAHFKAVREKLGHPPNARPYQGGIRFLPESEEEYRVVQRYLTGLEKEGGLSWFSYTLPAEQSVKVAIRGLPADTDVGEIEEELHRMGYQPEYVRNINARGGRPGCLFHAVITRTPDFRRIYDTTQFLNMRGVRIEAWRSKRGPAQCHRCQQFRHSSHQCHRPLACVRCGEGHAARDCPRPKTEPATCANCAGAHPACSSSCPVFQKEVRNRRAGTVAMSRQQQRQPSTNAEEHEAPSATLMAAANGPAHKDAPASRRRKRRNRRRGGRKGDKPEPPAPPPYEAPAPARAQAKKGSTQEPTDAAAGAGKTDKRASRPAKTLPATEAAGRKAAPAAAPASSGTAGARAQQRRREPDSGSHMDESRKRKFTACAVKLLVDLLKAIRQGQDVEDLILDGLQTLLSLCNG